MLPPKYSFTLRPSPLGGIGVFATSDIPTGTRLFRDIKRMTTIKTDDIPIAFKSFCIKTNGETSLCPENFEQMEIEWYINHSTEPNTAKLHDSDTSNQLEKINARTICAIKDIKAGDEILINYNYL